MFIVSELSALSAKSDTDRIRDSWSILWVARTEQNDDWGTLPTYILRLAVIVNESTFEETIVWSYVKSKDHNMFFQWVSFPSCEKIEET